MAILPLLLALLAPAVLAQSSVSSQLQSTRFTGFLRLLEHADLTPHIEEVSRSGRTLTIFAPTDEALLHNTSPTMLAFLKLKENKEVLRKLLLSHIVPERLSPFHWDGVKPSLEGAPLRLSMDTSAFYANDVAVEQYQAFVSGEACVHSLPTLMFPPGMAINAKSLVEESADDGLVRRVLQDGVAPSPAEAPESDRKAPVLGQNPKKEGSGAIARYMGSTLAVGVAVAAAALI